MQGQNWPSDCIVKEISCIQKNFCFPFVFFMYSSINSYDLKREREREPSAIWKCYYFGAYVNLFMVKLTITSALFYFSFFR